MASDIVGEIDAESEISVDIHDLIPRSGQEAASVSRTASGQQHIENTPHDNAEEYYRRSLFFPFLDHITQEKLHALIHLTKLFLILNLKNCR